MTNEFTREINAINDEVQQQQRAQLQPVQTDYYGFSGEDGRLNAALIVLLDSQERAIRAEVHFYGAQPTQTQNAVMRQSQSLLAARYLGSGATTSLFIMKSDTAQATIEVTHSGAEVPPEHRSYKLWPVLAAILGLFLLVAVGWAIVTLTRVPVSTDTPVTATPAGLAVAPAAATDTPANATDAGDPTIPPMRTNGLNPSINADGAIVVGSTVRIDPQYTSFVRTEPGGDQGEAAGTLQNGETAVVIGGPVWLQGDTDTIVWWYVELNNGTRGWTPANTSQLKLLSPVP